MEPEKKLKICFILGIDPFFDGGMGMYQRNLLEYLKSCDYEVSVVYFGKENKEFFKENVKYIELKSSLPYPLDQIMDNFKILKYIKKNDFDVINSHALWGAWMQFYKKRKNQTLVHTYHGVTYYFFKSHLERFNLIKKVLLSPLLAFSYLVEKPPMKKADKVICVSRRVQRELEKLYCKRKNIEFIRTGVDLQKFKIYEKSRVKRKLKLDQEKTYGLYVGRGGYWTKGLDRVIKISEGIYNLNKNYRLIVIGADLKKVGHLLNKKFILYIEQGKREMMPYYYNSADVFFCMSRYEGGAPTLVTSEAMASGCLVVCSKDSEQEIIEDKKNGLIIEEFGEKDAEKVLEILKDKKKKEEMIKNSIKTIKEISLETWGKKYLEVLFS